MTLKPKSFLARSLVKGLAILAVSVQGLQAQTPVPGDTLVASAREIINAARYCGLVTFDESGGTRVRTMDPFPPEPDMVVWMGTHRNSRKVLDIEKDPRVTLYYHSPTASGYVAISGTARLVDDPTEKSGRWKEEWGAFYADRETDYLLIQVIPNRMEVIDYSRGIQGDPRTWEPPFVMFPGGHAGL
ncbi:MAG: pyridoxamine 5'-phosphate oxidase family protein [Gemmatimonadota bacterium]